MPTAPIIMRRPARLAVALLLLALPRAWATAPDPVLPKGEIIGRVACRSDTAQTYALYLPSAYTADRTWPLIVCFDPSARGRLPVERFQAAAETLGYVVVGSNDSRNDAPAAQQRSLTAILDDVGARLAVAPDRLVFAGMSGGARLAAGLGQSGRAMAVIAVGAGFPETRAPRDVPFAFVGIVGVADFNHGEMLRTAAELQRRPGRHRLLVHDGGHEWMPPETAQRALEWLEREAMRAGRRPADPNALARMLAAELARAETLRPAARMREWEAILADFEGLTETADLSRRLAAHRRSPAVRTDIKVEREEEKRQEAAVAALLELAGAEDYAELHAVAADWRARAAAADDTSDRRVARRVLGNGLVHGGQAGHAALRQGEYGRAIPMLELATACAPERAFNFVALARAHAATGDDRAALAALTAARQNGFNDPPRLEQIEELVRLRAHHAYQALITGAAKP